MWCLLKLTIVLQCVSSVRIVNMRVPEVIQYGTRDKVTLDCDYITSNVTGLVVKWFYMDKSQPVYQWIPPQKPQALGMLKNKLDLSYKVSRNPYTQHRALRIASPDPEMTGNYTCVVSTFLAEDQRTKPMTIFVPETKFDMVADRLNDEFLDIICIVEGVFPKPELVILAGNRVFLWYPGTEAAPVRLTLGPGISTIPSIVDFPPGSNGWSANELTDLSMVLLNAKSSVHLVEGRYKASTSAVVRVDALPPTVEILCDMQVPLANYYSRKRDIFYKDPPPPTPTPKSPNSAQSQKDRGFRCLSTAMLIVLSMVLHFFRLKLT